LVSEQVVLCWLQMKLSSIMGIVILIALIWRNQVELIFHSDLARGIGSLEWMIVSSLLVDSPILFALAG
jgi:hypothetical protein